MIASILRCAATATLVAAAFSSLSAAAAPPTLEFLYPAGGRRGGSVAVTAGGKFETWPLQIWTDTPTIKAKAGKDKGAFTFEIDSAAAPGPHLVRVFDEKGASSPAVFIVGEQGELQEAEPNDETSQAQVIESLPTTLNGRLEKRGDVDTYAIKLETGQCLTAALLGRRLGSPMDPLLHLQDPSGEEIAFVHDGLGLDPLLVHHVQRSGTYLLRVSAFAYPPAADVNLTGAPADVYRLSLGVEPPIRFAIPAGGQRGAAGRIQLYDWFGNAVGLKELSALAPSAEEESILLSTNLLGEKLPLSLGSGRESTEAEAKESSQPLTPPVAITGCIEKSGEEDQYAFAMKQGERWTVSTLPAALASPVDLIVWRIENDQKKRLAGNESDNPAPVPPFTFDVPADGVYRIIVADMEHRGGPEFVYRLAVSPAMPGVAAALDADQYVVTPGQPTAIKLNVVRKNGHAAGLVAVAVDLPAGVTATSAAVPEKGGDVTLTLTAAADAPPANQPFHVMILGTDRKKPEAWTAARDLRNGTGQELIALTEQIWLTVPPRPPTTAPAAPK